MIDVKLKTGAWYNEREYKISFPDTWDVVTYWPDLPNSLTQNEIVDKLNSPIKSKPIKELLKGKSNPLIIIDDISRPTPVSNILKIVIDEFLDAGISEKKIEILVATGTHGPSDKKALANKVGKDIYNKYKVINHNDKKGVKYIGDTSYGTPVFFNSRVLKSDFIIGVGGIYPQHTTGFGGGAKLILGVSGRKTIASLHFNHDGVGGTYNIDNNFRKDLTEMAKLAKLENLITVHTNENLDVVNLFAGDYFNYYPEAASFSYNSYLVPSPDDADVIIANAFPSDVSYTFMKKGNFPLVRGSKEAIKIIVGSNHGGLGHHGLFPHGKSEFYMKIKRSYDQLSIMKWSVIFSKIVKKVKSKLIIKNEKEQNAQIKDLNVIKGNKTKNKLIVYVPPGGCDKIKVDGVEFITDWEHILSHIQQKFSNKKAIKVRIYPCSPIQCFKIVDRNLTGNKDTE